MCCETKDVLQLSHRNYRHAFWTPERPLRIIICSDYCIYESTKLAQVDVCEPMTAAFDLHLKIDGRSIFDIGTINI